MFELSQVMNRKGAMVNWAKNVELSQKNPNFEMSAEDKLITAEIDKWAREIGNGERPYKELSAYLQKVIQPEVYDAPQEILRLFFMDNGSIGEFDDWDISKAPKNTLKAYESARNGNVKASYIDFEKIAPVTKNLQIETYLKLEDLRRDGYVSVASVTQYAVNELRNKMFFHLFDTLDTTITGADQVATSAGGKVTKTGMDKLAKYIRGQRTSGQLTALCNSDNAFDIGELVGATTFHSDRMADQFNNDGMIRKYAGSTIQEIESSRETGNGEKLINPARVYGSAGQIGEMALKGNLRVLSEENINDETLHLKFAGFQFVYAITYPEKAFKLTITA